jgi:hypothetical protein
MGQVQRQIFNLTVKADVSIHTLPTVKCGYTNSDMIIIIMMVVVAVVIAGVKLIAFIKVINVNMYI